MPGPLHPLLISLSHLVVHPSHPPFPSSPPALPRQVIPYFPHQAPNPHPISPSPHPAPSLVDPTSRPSKRATSRATSNTAHGTVPGSWSGTQLTGALILIFGQSHALLRMPGPECIARSKFSGVVTGWQSTFGILVEFMYKVLEQVILRYFWQALWKLLRPQRPCLRVHQSFQSPLPFLIPTPTPQARQVPSSRASNFPFVGFLGLVRCVPLCGVTCFHGCTCFVVCMMRSPFF